MLANIIAKSKRILKLKHSFTQLRNLYDTLGIPQHASFKQIKQKYLQKSKQLHPDISTSNFQLYHQVQQAYKTLNNPQTRKRYDLSLGIINSVWQRQINNLQFSKEFQSEYYEEILKHDKIKVEANTKSMQQILMHQFAKEIDQLKPKDWIFSLPFIGTLFGFGLIWTFWNIAEFIIINHEGTQSHQVQYKVTDSSLKIVPLISR